MKNTYWNENGKYQKVLDREIEKDTELVKLAWAVYYDIFNNGVSDQTIDRFNRLTKNKNYLEVNLSDKAKVTIEKLNKFNEVFSEKSTLVEEEEIDLWEYEIDNIAAEIEENIEYFLDSILFLHIKNK